MNVQVLDLEQMLMYAHVKPEEKRFFRTGVNLNEWV